MPCRLATADIGSRSASRMIATTQIGEDAPVVERMKELSALYPRYGYRRIRIFLGRDGYRRPGRAHRLWRNADLQSQTPEEAPCRGAAAALCAG